MISIFQQELNVKTAKARYLGAVAGFGYANLKNDGVYIKPKMSSKRKARIKKGVRLTDKYCSAKRQEVIMKYEVSTTKFIGVMNTDSPTVARSITFLNLYGYIVKNNTPTIDLDGTWHFDNSFHFKPIK